jgi:hypothetical protein
VKVYVSVKLVKAKIGPNPKDNHGHPMGEVGYVVIHEDGHESWSPKDEFEDEYKPLVNGYGIEVTG